MAPEQLSDHWKKSTGFKFDKSYYSKGKNMKHWFIFLLPSILITLNLYSEGLKIIEKQDSQVTFQTNIQPILKKHCYRCHQSRFLAQGGLRLNSLKSILKGGNSGPMVVPGTPEKSLILKRITVAKDDHRRMPPGGGEMLTTEEILLVKKWIQQGVK